MSVYRYKKSWKAEIWINNKRIVAKAGFKTKQAATRWKTLRLAELAIDPELGKVGAEQRRTFDELLNRYQEVHLPTIRQETVRRYQSDLDLRLRPFFRYFPLSAITPSLIEEFRSSLMKSKLAMKSINNCTDLLRSILNKALKWDWIAKNPYRLDPLKIGHQAYQWWDDKAQIRNFLATIKGCRYEAAFRLGLEFGVRLGEIVGLSKQDVSFDMGVLHIHRQWNEKDRAYGPPKHNKARYIRFESDSDFGKCLKNAVCASGDREVIFVTNTGKRVLNRKLAADLFQHRIKAAGVPTIRFHDLRHTFASWFMIQNGDIWSLMQILGHSNIKTTMRYSHHSGKHQKAPNLNWSQKKLIDGPLSFPSPKVGET